MKACGSDFVAPVEIRLRTVAKVLEMDWQDGSTTIWAHRVLRESCLCAVCTAQRRKGRAVVAAVDIALIEVMPCGSGALRFSFSDGHARGIYPFEYLWHSSGRSHSTLLTSRVSPTTC